LNELQRTDPVTADVACEEAPGQGPTRTSSSPPAKPQADTTHGDAAQSYSSPAENSRNQEIFTNPSDPRADEYASRKFG
jgi:hypothetical protein